MCTLSFGLLDLSFRPPFRWHFWPPQLPDRTGDPARVRSQSGRRNGECSDHEGSGKKSRRHNWIRYLYRHPRLYFLELVKARAVTALCKNGAERDRDLGRFDADVEHTNEAIAARCL